MPAGEASSPRDPGTSGAGRGTARRDPAAGSGDLPCPAPRLGAGVRAAEERGRQQEEEEEGSAMTHLQAGLSPETLEKARLELNENPDTLHQDIQEVRDMVITRPDIGFLRTDDAFILCSCGPGSFNTSRRFASWPSTLSTASRTWTCSRASRPPTRASNRR